LAETKLLKPVRNLLHGWPLRIYRYPFWTDRTESLPQAQTGCIAHKLSTDAYRPHCGLMAVASW
jgi:hypothetical protein